MTFMPNTGRRLERSAINRQIETDPRRFVAEECARYDREVEDVARWLNNEQVRRRVLLLSGPSASGKTTTAARLCAHLHRYGADACVVSLDDFYVDRADTPLLPDGTPDLETPYALNLDLLAKCITQLLTDGYASLPRYDFATGRSWPNSLQMRLTHRSVVIFEGIHALHPALREHLPKKHVKRLLIGTASPFYNGDTEVISTRQTRLLRRLVRDIRHRNTTAAETLAMWPQVAAGEERYLFPHAGDADRVIDTTHAFEVGMLAVSALPELQPLRQTVVSAAALCEALDAFVPLSADFLPGNSVLNEFLR